MTSKVPSAWSVYAVVDGLGQCGCESFMKTLKYEEVYRQEYRDAHPTHRRRVIALTPELTSWFSGLSMAGFEVTLYGRIWVGPPRNERDPKPKP